ncbi:MAG: hypothetical protein WBB68_05370 [Candidatus Moraniibacteriota bacterium]
MRYHGIKYRRIRMFWYDHGAAVLSTAGVLATLGFIALLMSVDCSAGGSCLIISDGIADAVLGPRK